MAAEQTTRATRAPLAFGDALLALGIVVAGTAATEGVDGFTAPVLGVGIAGAVVLVVALWWQNAYVVTRSIRWNGDGSLLVRNIALVSVAMVIASWLLTIEHPRLWQVAITVGWLVSMLALRFVLSRRAAQHTEPVRVIVAGNTLDALAVRLALRSDPRTTYDVQGFVMDRLDENVPDVVTQLALGSIDHLPHVVQKAEADLVVVCLGAMDAERFAPMVRQLNVLGVEVALSTGLGKVALRRVNLGHVSGRPLVRITPAPLGGWHLAVKRLVDIVGSSLLITLFGPVMALIAVAIRIEDGGKSLFKQVRVGKAGEPFTILKFRTMVQNAEQLQVDLTNDHEGPVFKMRADPRVTRIGRILRKTSMDELPQLFNILRGDMSLVGPRPLPVHEVEAAPASFLDRQAVKPGLTGRWQVSGRSDTGFAELDELDRWYVDNWSLGQDLEILARTVPAVLLARGAR